MISRQRKPSKGQAKPAAPYPHHSNSFFHDGAAAEAEIAQHTKHTHTHTVNMSVAGDA